MTKKKNSNINITIENNLLSKNKNDKPVEDDDDTGGKGKGGIKPAIMYNYQKPEDVMPSEIQTYYALQAQKKLYGLTPQPHPINIGGHILGGGGGGSSTPPRSSTPPAMPPPGTAPPTPAGGAAGAAAGGGGGGSGAASSYVLTIQNASIAPGTRSAPVLDENGDPISTTASPAKVTGWLRSRSNYETLISTGTLTPGKVSVNKLVKLGLLQLYKKHYGVTYNYV